MIYLITYDIDDDKQRDKISKVLENYGVRVQESVFECNLSSANYKEVVDRISKIISESANIRFYPICKECYSKAAGFGNLVQLPGLKGYEII
ncbi:MAG: CRISPR-associated endonuclease Cas2 [Bacteroidota bacterium]|jgi:CRISPR-associated protein Cas2